MTRLISCLREFIDTFNQRKKDYKNNKQCIISSLCRPEQYIGSEINLKCQNQVSNEKDTREEIDEV